MITGMPLSGIGLLRQADLEGTARAQAARRGEAGPTVVSLDLVQPLPPRAGSEGVTSTERHRIDIRV